MSKLKVLVVDDTAIYRKIISDIVNATGLGAVEATASDGESALEHLKHLNIDVVLLDVFMPGMDGLSVLRKIKEDYSAIEVIIISGGGPDYAQMTIDALDSGALDFLLKPSDISLGKNVNKIKSHILILFAQIKIKKYSLSTIEGIRPDTAMPSARPDTFPGLCNPTNSKGKAFKGPADLIIIVSSTGGPTALEKVCSQLPSDLRKPILIVQHMPPDFTRMLANSLNTKSSLKIFEGKDGDEIKAGEVIVAPGGLHMTVEALNLSTNVVRLEKTPLVNGVRPAADVLFKSIARAYAGRNILAVVMTGMGNDGTRGIIELKKKANCYCITQNESSCVVYGMPRSVYDAGLSDEIADLSSIANRVYKVAMGLN